MDHAGLGICRIAELFKKEDKLVIAAVHVSYDVKRAVNVLFIVPHLRADNLRLINFLLRVQNIDKAEAFLLEVPDAATEI